MLIKILFTLLGLVIINFLTLAQITVNAVGDIMLGSVTPKTVLPPDSGNEFVESISQYLNGADIVFGNLEGSLITDDLIPQKCKEESRKAGRCYEFGMPEILAFSLQKLGFNVLNMDNNHSEDYGMEGYTFTQQKLSELGIKFAPKQGFASLTLKERHIAVVAFGYSGNSYSISNLEETTKIISSFKKEFDFIIVSFHGGAEGRNALNIYNETEFFLGENRGNVIAFAHTAIEAGADLVIGHGPHVLRAIEIYNNKLIAYSMGNFLTYGNMNISGVTGVTAILKAEIDENTGDFLIGKIIPVIQVDRGIPVYDKSFEAVDLITNLTKKDFPESKIIFHPKGYFFDLLIKAPEPRSRLEWSKIKSKKKNVYKELMRTKEIKKPGID
jgi:poly-gamma-glutamate capsule biosynthesis protein CapA/YwtB (metallophosphatase superfamily)